MAGSLDSVHPSMDGLWDVFDSLWTDPSMDGLLDGSGLDWEASCPTYLRPRLRPMDVQSGASDGGQAEPLRNSMLIKSLALMTRFRRLD